MLSAFCEPNTTWCSVDISAAFLTAKIPPEQLVLLKPPKSLVDLKMMKDPREPDLVSNQSCLWSESSTMTVGTK
eukprot:376184-Amphidinium_carterae.2